THKISRFCPASEVPYLHPIIRLRIGHVSADTLIGAFETSLCGIGCVSTRSRKYLHPKTAYLYPLPIFFVNILRTQTNHTGSRGIDTVLCSEFLQQVNQRIHLDFHDSGLCFTDLCSS